MEISESSFFEDDERNLSDEELDIRRRAAEDLHAAYCEDYQREYAASLEADALPDEDASHLPTPTTPLSLMTPAAKEALAARPAAYYRWAAAIAEAHAELLDERYLALFANDDRLRIADWMMRMIKANPIWAAGWFRAFAKEQHPDVVEVADWFRGVETLPVPRWAFWRWW